MKWLSALGLNIKQQKVYLCLLENGTLTAAQLSATVHEQRTNIYIIVEQLTNLGLVEKDESLPVTRFKVTNPENLQTLMLAKQRNIAESNRKLKAELPELLGMFHLKTAHEGLAYFEGLKGYEAALEEMSKTKDEVCVFGASLVRDARPDAWNVLIHKLQKRAVAKIKTRIIFEESQKSSDLTVDTSSLLKKYMEARFWGNSLFDGEIALYDTTIVLTTYDEKLISLIIKNPRLATTFKTIFNTAWEESAP